jgi:hypothetical protein
MTIKTLIKKLTATKTPIIIRIYTGVTETGSIEATKEQLGSALKQPVPGGWKTNYKVYWKRGYLQTSEMTAKELATLLKEKELSAITHEDIIGLELGELVDGDMQIQPPEGDIIDCEYTFNGVNKLEVLDENNTVLYSI